MSLLWSAGRNTVKHSLDAQIFIYVGPMNSLSISDDLVIVALNRRGVTQSPRPRQRDANNSAINEIKRNQIFGNAGVLYPGINVNRSAHSNPPESYSILFQ